MEAGYVIVLMFWPRSCRMEKHELHFVRSELLTARKCFGEVLGFFLKPYFGISVVGFICVFYLYNPLLSLTLLWEYVQGCRAVAPTSGTWDACFTTACGHKKIMQTQVVGSHVGSRGSGKFGNCSCALMFFHTLVAAHYVFLFSVCLGCVKIKCQAPK